MEEVAKRKKEREKKKTHWRNASGCDVDAALPHGDRLEAVSIISC